MKETFDSTYRTGSARPPRRKGGGWTVILMVLIFFGGLYSLGILRAGLLKPLMVTEETLPEVAQVEQGGEPDPYRVSRDELSLALSEAPADSSGTPLSAEAIYLKNAATIVTVTAEHDGVERSCQGVLLSSDGYLVTSGKVVEDAESVSIRFFDQSESLAAELIASDTLSDLAILRTEEGYLPAEFGDPEALTVADSVFSLVGGKVTECVVRRGGETIRYGDRAVFTIGTQPEEGGIGTPLWNRYGQVVAIRTCAGGDGAYVSALTVRQVLSELLKTGEIAGSPSLGFAGKTVPLISQIYGHLPVGIYVSHVYGRDRGVQPGDVITALDDCSILHMSELEMMLYERNIGDTVSLSVFRDGAQITVTLEVQRK